MVRLPCRPIRRELASEQGSHDHDQEADNPNNLKSSSDREETKPLMANKHNGSSVVGSYSGHGSITNHGSFVSSINSTEDEDFNNIHLISPTHVRAKH